MMMSELIIRIFVPFGSLAAGINAKYTHDKDAKLQKYKRGGGYNGYGPTGTKYVIRIVISGHKNCKLKVTIFILDFRIQHCK